MALLSTLAKPVSAVLDDSRPRLRRQTLAMAADPIQPDNRKGTREPSFGEYLASAVVLGDAAAIRAISDWMSQNTAGGDIREDWPTMMALVTQARAAIKPLVEDLASAGREAADEAWALHADSQIAKRLEAAGLARDARAGAGWATLAFKLVAKERGKKSWKTLEKEWKRRDSRRGTRSRSN